MTGRQYYRLSYLTWKQNVQRFHSSNWITSDPSATLGDDTEVIVYIEATEKTHRELNQDSNFHPMSLIMIGSPLCSDCVNALSGHGVQDGDTMFQAARKLQRVHQGLAPQRF